VYANGLINSSFLVMKHKLYSLSLKMLYLYSLNAQKKILEICINPLSLTFWLPSTLCTQVACDDVLQLCLCVLIHKARFIITVLRMKNFPFIHPCPAAHSNCTRLKYEIRSVCKLTDGSYWNCKRHHMK